jgi:hypothetical protein
MKKILFVLWAISTSTANADVYKCKVANNATEYQAAPCASSAAQQALVDIKPMTAQQQEQAKIKLQAWQAEYGAYETAKATAEHKQARQTQLNKQTGQGSLTRKLAAMERRALVSRRLATQPGHRNKTNARRHKDTMMMPLE